MKTAKFVDVKSTAVVLRTGQGVAQDLFTFIIHFYNVTLTTFYIMLSNVLKKEQ